MFVAKICGSSVCLNEQLFNSPVITSILVVLNLDFCSFEMQNNVVRNELEHKRLYVANLLLQIHIVF